MEKSRRNFLKNVGKITAGAVTVMTVTPASAEPKRRGGDPKHRWAMVVDLRKCIGCQACTVSCSMENVPPIGQFRTIVSQYEVKNVDKPGQPVGNFMLPRLCNHCDNPPCIPVCPVQATYQQEDGVVLIDNEICVGCGYCVQACPYDARFINKETKTADKCTFCYHRVKVGLLPACVESCVGGARIFGDVRDPNSEVSKLIDTNDVKVLRPEMNTKPHNFYIGMDEHFEGKVQGEPPIWDIRNAKGEEIEES